jgi:hypothetical protein
MDETPVTFRYKLDFYYQSALIYLVTLILYGGIRGNFVERKFEYVLGDPLMYVIILFVLVSLVVLVLARIRNRRLIISRDEIVLASRWHERRLPVAEMEWLHIGREAHVQTSGRFQVIVFKMKGQRRLIRIRVGRYERGRELVQQMQRLAQRVPRRKHPRWRRPRVLDR